MSNFIKRSITGILFVILLLFMINLGSIPFLLFMIFIIILGLNEFYNLSSKIGYKSNKYLGIIFSILISILFFINNGEISVNFQKNASVINNSFCIFLTLFLILIFSFSIIFSNSKNEENNFKSIFTKNATTLFGVFYIGWLFNHLILVREIPVYGKDLTLILFFCVWIMDTFAYIFGMQIGKHKFSKISPNKSIEGCFFGLIFAILASIILHNFIFKTNFGIKNSIIIGIIIGIFGQIGDLFESMIKRSAEQKDSGNILPGHGGILDRFDSIIFTAPIYFYFIKIFVNN